MNTLNTLSLIRQAELKKQSLKQAKLIQVKKACGKTVC